MAKQLDGATARLGTERVGRLLLEYSIPSIIGMVMMSLYNIVDRIFIGQGVGPLAISGLALTFPLTALVTAIGTLIGVGSAARISIVLGIPYAKDYLRIVIPGSVLSNLSYSFSNIMRASGYPSKSMYTILIGVGLNILLDPLFIFGFGMEIRGAAVATVISMFVSRKRESSAISCRSAWLLS